MLKNKYLQKIMLNTLSSAGLTSKHLQRLAIILSCTGLMSNTLACGPDASESREYTVKLRGALAGEFYEEVRISLTQQQFCEIESGKCPEGFVQLLNNTEFSNLPEN